MSDYWLHSQHNCSSEFAASMLEASRLNSLPFTSRYDCPIFVSNASTPGSVFTGYRQHCAKRKPAGI